MEGGELCVWHDRVEEITVARGIEGEDNRGQREGGGARENGGDHDPPDDMPSLVFDESEDGIEEDEGGDVVIDHDINRWLMLGPLPSRL